MIALASSVASRHTLTMPRPTSSMNWTPGPTGKPEPPVLDDLVQTYLHEPTGPAGIRIEDGTPWEHGDTKVVVSRGTKGQPLGLIVMRMYRDDIGLIDFVVDPAYRRLGISDAMIDHAYEEGIDLRDAGAIWDGPLTADGVALRDAVVARMNERYGPPAWEADDGGE